MNRKRRTEEEKRESLKQVEALVAEGSTIEEACKRVGIWTSQWSSWRKRFAGHPNGHAREIKQRSPDNEKVLRIENQRLKIIVAEQALDLQALKEWRAR